VLNFIVLDLERRSLGNWCSARVVRRGDAKPVGFYTPERRWRRGATLVAGVGVGSKLIAIEFVRKRAMLRGFSNNQHQYQQPALRWRRFPLLTQGLFHDAQA